MSEFLFLGTGSSMGVPVIRCQCSVCLSQDPKNKRLRPSGLLSIGGKKILIDASPDYRKQALNYNLDHIDGVILTHAHHDHTAGVDDLRVYCIDKILPFLLSHETAEEMKMRFGYIFAPKEEKGLVTRVNMQILQGDRGEASFLEETFSFMSFYQLGMKVTGFRTGNFAYISDIRDYDETIFDPLMGVETLVLSAIGMEPTRMHLSVDEAVAFSRKTQAKKTWITHISHKLDHDKTNAYLPADIQLAYDGLTIEC